MSTYDTHDLADLRAALGCEYFASIDEMSDAARRLRSLSMERDSLVAMAADALGCERLDGPASAVMRRIEQLRAFERHAQERLALLHDIARILSPDHHPSPDGLLDYARKAAQAVLDGYKNESRWGIATQTLATLRAGIGALRAAARLDEALTDGKVIEHAAAALERWRAEAAAAAAAPGIFDALPLVAGHTWAASDCSRTVQLLDKDGAVVAEIRRDKSGWWSLTRGGRPAADFAKLGDAVYAIVRSMEPGPFLPAPAGLPPMVVAWREATGGCALVRVDGDDEPTLIAVVDDGLGAWRISPASHHDGYAGPLPPITVANRAQAEALVLALVRAANPDRRVDLEAPCAP